MRPKVARDSRIGDGASATILELARRQHGVVAWRQLERAGISRRVLRTRVEAGWLVRLHRGVYAVGGRELSWRGRWQAAVLACGDTALLSHGAAASLWRLTPPTPGDIDVTVPGSGGRSAPIGIAMHRSTTLADEDRTTRDGIPVTSPVRTIIDLARGGLAGRSLERLLDESERLGLLDPAAFSAEVHPGGKRLPGSLRAVLASHQPGSTMTRSELEERFLALCRERGLTQPLVNAPLLGLTVDFFWPGAALVVEVDGRGSHGTRRAFQDDRDRDSMLAAAGFRTVRFTWWDVNRRAEVVAQRLAKLLERTAD